MYPPAYATCLFKDIIFLIIRAKPLIMSAHSKSQDSILS